MLEAPAGSDETLKAAQAELQAEARPQKTVGGASHSHPELNPFGVSASLRNLKQSPGCSQRRGFPHQKTLRTFFGKIHARGTMQC